MFIKKDTHCTVRSSEIFLLSLVSDVIVELVLKKNVSFLKHISDIKRSQRSEIDFFTCEFCFFSFIVV